MSAPTEFVFAACQVGAESALKDEVARKFADWRVAFSRPGLVTFKLPDDKRLPLDFAMNVVFARAHGFSLGTVTGNSQEELAAAVWGMVGESTFHQLHCWQRDAYAPGDHDFEPHVTAEAQAARVAIVGAMPDDRLLANAHDDRQQIAQRGQLVLDVVLVEKDQWLVGVHAAAGFASRYPGGLVELPLPDNSISRAYLKMEEAIRWSRMPLAKGDLCVDVGCAPGGTSRALLTHGVKVLGIDPAKVDPGLVEHPNFTHVQKRAVDLRRKEFANARWLFSDMNVAPQYTLDTAEAIVEHDDVNMRGMLLTLKLSDWKMAAQIPTYLDRIRGWGYRIVYARQLKYNRQEICVAAFKRREVQRPVRRKRRGANTHRDQRR
jgi:23S rRNA (cytidine2498-2'-O)-methyltransferase